MNTRSKGIDDKVQETAQRTVVRGRVDWFNEPAHTILLFKISLSLYWDKIKSPGVIDYADLTEELLGHEDSSLKDTKPSPDAIRSRLNNLKKLGDDLRKKEIGRAHV